MSNVGGATVPSELSADVSASSKRWFEPIRFWRCLSGFGGASTVDGLDPVGAAKRPSAGGRDHNQGFAPSFALIVQQLSLSGRRLAVA
jgi:hypothetical protein